MSHHWPTRQESLVGVNDFVLRGDLRDRSVFLHLEPIPPKSRRAERAFWPEFRADYPKILGDVLAAIAGDCASCHPWL